jgi:hypothetical protein
LFPIETKENKNMNPQTRTVTVINQIEILVIENDQKLVPIKPICEALGVGFASQKEKIEKHEILGSESRLSICEAADGKQRQMFCLPIKYVLGWVFTINPLNVKEEAKQTVTMNKKACYEALCDFTFSEN